MGVSNQSKCQIDGRAAHESIDNGTYYGKKNILSGIDVYCEKYGLQGKIDILDIQNKELIERKNYISHIYDGQIFQLYAQYFAVTEMGYEIKNLTIRSKKDNKKYVIPLPKDDIVMFTKFEKTLDDMRNFTMDDFMQINTKKCIMCIYEPSCDRSISC